MPPIMCTSSIPLLSGRFGTPTIDQTEVDRIRDLNVRAQAASIMDHIKDWFCGTKRVEAKKRLYDMMRKDTGLESENVERIMAFFKLKRLCAEPFRTNFKVWIEKDGVFFIGIAKDYQLFYHHDKLHNNDMQFTDFDIYNRLRGRTENRTEFNNEPKAMQALLRQNPLFPLERSIKGCSYVSDRHIRHGMKRTTYSIASDKITSGETRMPKNDKHMEDPRYHTVDIWHDDKKVLFIGRVKETN